MGDLPLAIELAAACSKLLHFVLRESGYNLWLASVADALPLNPADAPTAILLPLVGPDSEDLDLSSASRSARTRRPLPFP